MKPALILDPTNVASLVEVQKKEHGSIPIVTTSGGFVPLHVGHTRCIRDSAKLKGKKGLLIVIVNGDGFLMRKKGFVFMPLAERMEIISHLKGVDYVVPWDDGSQFVTGAVRLIKPNIFAKGGDRSTAENVPEYETCLEIGCTVVFGMGGSEKVQSSSKLTMRNLGRVKMPTKKDPKSPPQNV
jgi:D-beta-D-heptose 7-phosphate kinase/D-beta-D-heptose 1-phosphate adenosyltransferase